MVAFEHTAASLETDHEKRHHIPSCTSIQSSAQAIEISVHGAALGSADGVHRRDNLASHGSEQQRGRTIRRNAEGRRETCNKEGCEKEDRKKQGSEKKEAGQTEGREKKESGRQEGRSESAVEESRGSENRQSESQEESEQDCILKRREDNLTEESCIARHETRQTGRSSKDLRPKKGCQKEGHQKDRRKNQSGTEKRCTGEEECQNENPQKGHQEDGGKGRTGRQAECKEDRTGEEESPNEPF
ncbi:MAG: hypothetical protein MPJ78_14615 [Hyphomicrobiaceae bacterium]|nr:hypothetical protein [Hyphomicrobiaceae bacterium]